MKKCLALGWLCAQSLIPSGFERKDWNFLKFNWSPREVRSLLVKDATIESIGGSRKVLLINEENLKRFYDVNLNQLKSSNISLCARIKCFTFSFLPLFAGIAMGYRTSKAQAIPKKSFIGSLSGFFVLGWVGYRMGSDNLREKQLKKNPRVLLKYLKAEGILGPWQPFGIQGLKGYKIYEILKPDHFLLSMIIVNERESNGPLLQKKAPEPREKRKLPLGDDDNSSFSSSSCLSLSLLSSSSMEKSVALRVESPSSTSSSLSDLSFPIKRSSITVTLLGEDTIVTINLLEKWTGELRGEFQSEEGYIETTVFCFAERTFKEHDRKDFSEDFLEAFDTFLEEYSKLKAKSRFAPVSTGL